MCVHLDRGGAVILLDVFCDVGGGICHTLEAHAMHVVCFDVGDLVAEPMALLQVCVCTCLLHSRVYGMYLCARALLRAFADVAHHLAHGVAMLRYPGAGQVAGEAHTAALQVSTRADVPRVILGLAMRRACQAEIFRGRLETWQA